MKPISDVKVLTILYSVVLCYSFAGVAFISALAIVGAQ